MNETRMFRPPRQLVTDDDVSKALDLFNDENPAQARAEWELEKAENDLERIWAEVYGKQTGTGKDKEAAADCNQRVREARDRVADKRYEVNRCKTRSKWADKVCDIWRTQSSNTRSAHSVR